MKPTTFSKKLTINKKTISDLSSREMGKVEGGSCGGTCDGRATCNGTCSCTCLTACVETCQGGCTAFPCIQ